MKEKLRRAWQKVREKYSDFHDRGSGMFKLDALKTRAEAWAPLAQKSLLRVPGLDETLARFGRVEWVAWIVTGLVAADLSMTVVGHLIQSKGPAAAVVAPTRRVVNLDPYVRNYDEYSRVLKLERPKDCGNAKPYPAGTVKLIGTIVLSDPQYSVATISRGSESVALQKGDTFSGIGEVYEIRQGRVCFIVGTGALQFIDLPGELIKFDTPVAKAAPRPSFQSSSTPGIERISETEFQIAKDALMKKLQDPSLLSDAHAPPYREDGELKGFKLLSIKPGSVYESLGVQVGDIITGVNGEPMNSVARAQELYASLMSLDKVSITVNRNGQDVTTTYYIK
jgi:type II secretion system protein C